METIGFDTKGKSLALINAEAKALGMSYGKYVCAIRSGSIEQRLIATGLSPQQWRAKLREARKIFFVYRKGGANYEEAVYQLSDERQNG